ncbi:Uncharacterised protein [Anaerococcus prevotii]|uniref:Uncharacterized protein n=1 Tax=Anaerococcus prevotii (strain ATCC 9321 / DSM 20548 / JCM 6508 / NCTC 11806 / PC1) TaxID=525919 RepID=C7RE60_ANAPD|nr:hypothetical protein [Anaerococcus prevotii]ACV29473.1 hypothetical protein Apre_1452 [Anaerococcus prevotii DSM 20548]SUU95147.1 Uncharacterised protein [Anaerococcus prevotii]
MSNESKEINKKKIIYECVASIFSGIVIALVVYFMFQRKIDQRTIDNYPISVDIGDIEESSGPKKYTTFDINLNINQGKIVRASYININGYNRDKYIINDVKFNDSDRSTIKASVVQETGTKYIAHIQHLVSSTDFSSYDKRIYPLDIQEYFIWIEDLTGKISTYYLLYAPELNFEEDIKDTLESYRIAGIKDEEMTVTDKFGGFYIFEDLKFINKATLKDKFDSNDFKIRPLIEFKDPDKPIKYSESHVSFKRTNTMLYFLYREIDVDKLFDELMYLKKEVTK